MADCECDFDSRPGPVNQPQKLSSATSKAARKLNTPRSDADSVLSPNPLSKAPKDRSSKVVDRKSPRVVNNEKKECKNSELESPTAHLEEELKKAKDQLSTSELSKMSYQLEVEEVKRQLAAMSAKLEDTEKQLDELCESEEARVQELCKISHDRDRAWQSELEVVQKQQLMDSAAFSSALAEINRLKMQLERILQSEASQARRADLAYAENQSLRMELQETVALAEKLNAQLNDSRESEAPAVEEASLVQMQLEAVNTSKETLKLEHAKALESYNSLLLELEDSKHKVSSLEELIGELRGDQMSKKKSSSSSSVDAKISTENGEPEVNILRNEVGQLISALEAAERMYREEYIQSTLEIRNAYQLVEQVKSESRKKEAELEAELKEFRAQVEELRTKLAEKENAFKGSSWDDERKAELDIELNKSESSWESLNATLLDREVGLRSILEQNELLKSEIVKCEIERIKANDEAIALVDAVRAAEREAVMKLSSLSEEADERCKQVARVIQELQGAQSSNCEMEAELRRIKVQCDQWRKAAEAAAAMLSAGNNGKYGERIMDPLDYHAIGRKLSFQHSEDTDDDSHSPKKKNGNMLKKIGVLLKKGQK